MYHISIKDKQYREHNKKNQKCNTYLTTSYVSSKENGLFVGRSRMQGGTVLTYAVCTLTEPPKGKIYTITFTENSRTMMLFMTRKYCTNAPKIEKFTSNDGVFVNEPPLRLRHKKNFQVSWLFIDRFQRDKCVGMPNCYYGTPVLHDQYYYVPIISLRRMYLGEELFINYGLQYETSRLYKSSCSKSSLRALCQVTPFEMIDGLPPFSSLNLAVLKDDTAGAFLFHFLKNDIGITPLSLDCIQKIQIEELLKAIQKNKNILKAAEYHRNLKPNKIEQKYQDTYPLQDLRNSLLIMKETNNRYGTGWAFFEDIFIIIRSRQFQST